MVRVLVADDSPTARALLVSILDADPDIQVIAQATDGEQALHLAQTLRPDLVTMDLQMPRLDGLQATQRLMDAQPTPIVVISGLDVSDVELSMNVLRAGALAVLPKPSGPASPSFEQERRTLISTVKALARVRLLRRPSSANPSVSRLARPRVGTRPEVIAIAASTGGPGALDRVIGELPKDFAAPVLVVQHIAIGFAAGLASWLGGNPALGTGGSRLRVKVAESGEPLRAGTVYLAPDDRHLGVADRGSVLLSDSPPIGGFRPSATYLFQSVARAFGPASAAVLLTGMGRDGVDGMRAVRQAGGHTAVQDEATSQVWGMPGAAVDEGLADHVIPLDALSAHLRTLVHG